MGFVDVTVFTAVKNVIIMAYNIVERVRGINYFFRKILIKIIKRRDLNDEFSANRKRNVNNHKKAKGY